MTNQEIEEKLDAIADKYDLDRETVGGVFSQLHDYWKDNTRLLNDTWIDPLTQGLNLETASGFYLDYQGASWNGITRHPAVRAKGKMLITTDKSFNLPEGTIFYSANNREFATIGSSFIEAPNTTVEIEATQSGIASNLASGTELKTDRVFIGFTKAQLPYGWIEREGENKETDEQMRRRIKDRFTMDTTGDISVKFRTFAMTVEGVRDVAIWRTPRGNGSMDVVLAATDGAVTDKMLSEVRAILEDKFLIAWDIGIVPAEKRTLNIKAMINDTSLSQESVEEIINQYVLSLPIAGTFQPKDLYGKLSHKVNILEPRIDTTADHYTEWQAFITFVKDES